MLESIKRKAFVIQKLSLKAETHSSTIAVRRAISIFSISLKMNRRSFLSKRYNIITCVKLESDLKILADFGACSNGCI